MIESLEEAVTASNEAKQKALLSFAKEFDAACSALVAHSGTLYWFVCVF